jgi:hypothetical protein
LFWDINVENLEQVAHRGEFIAVAQRISLFELMQRVQDETYFGSTALSQQQGYERYAFSSSYPGHYFVEPTWDKDWWERHNGNGVQCGGFEDNVYDSGNGGGDGNWVAALSADGVTQGGTANVGRLTRYGAVELVEFYVRMRGADWGITTPEGEKTAVWHVVLLNGKRIVLCEPDTAPHGLLPIQITALQQDDVSFLREKSLAELLVPFQEHAQDILNKMQMTLKKGIQGGLTLFDSRYVELDANKSPISGYVPVKNLPETKDINAIVKQLAGLPDSNNSLNHVNGMLSMLEMIVPTQQAQQVADLQRATEFQAAATVAATAKRHQTLAKLVDDQLFAPVRRMELMLTLQNVSVFEVVDDQGQLQQVYPAALVDAGLEFDISSGLLGMDRLILSSRIFQVMNLIVQGNLATSVDFLKLIDYWTTMIGDKTDFSMFKLVTPFDALPPEQKQAAFDALQQVQATTANGGRSTVPSDATGRAQSA